MQFGLFESVEVGKHNVTRFVQISNIFVTQEIFLFEKAPFDSV